MRVRRAVQAVMAAAVAVSGIACADDQRSVSVLVYTELRDEAYCQHLVSCGALPDLETCRRFAHDGPVSPDLVALVLEGDVHWAPAAAEDCVERFARLSCDRTSEAGRVLGCDRIIVGDKPEGAACAWHLECASRECFVPPCDDACCVGTCYGDTPLQPGRLGEPCYLTGCAEGRCDGSLCVAFVEEGGACVVDEECAYGLGCSYPSRTCAVLAGPGEICALVNCRDIGTRCSENFRCVPLASDATCGPFRECGQFYECGADGRCRLAQLADLGEPCSVFDRACAKGTTCSTAFTFEMGVCEPLLAEGAACLDGSQCASARCDRLGVCSAEACLAPST